MNKSFENRINRVIGQLESLKNNMTEDYDCEYVISQLKVVVGSVKSLSLAIAEEDIEKCLKDKKTIKEHKKTLNSILQTAFK